MHRWPYNFHGNVDVLQDGVHDSLVFQYHLSGGIWFFGPELWEIGVHTLGCASHTGSAAVSSHQHRPLNRLGCVLLLTELQELVRGLRVALDDVHSKAAVCCDEWLHYLLQEDTAQLLQEGDQNA